MAEAGALQERGTPLSKRLRVLRGPAPPGVEIVLRLVVVGFAVLLAVSGSPAWRVARVALVLVAGLLASVALRRGGRLTAALVTAAVGVAATAAGLGVGALHLAAGAVSVRSVAATVLLPLGVGLLVRAAVLVGTGTHGWRRGTVTGVAVLVVAVLGLYPLTVAVVATNRAPTSIGGVTPADRGLAFVDVTLRTADGIPLAGWYVASDAGAAVVVRHGSGETRADVLDEAAVLASHGYGVLLLDARGHGDSGGTAMDLGWAGDLDTAAAVDFLDARPDVDPGRIGALGTSMGGEEVLGAAAVDPRIRAVVAEGVTARSAADEGWLPSHPGRFVNIAAHGVRDAAAAMLSGLPPPTPLREAVAATAPRPVLLVTGGAAPDEARAAAWLRAGAPGSVAVWTAAGAGHTAGLATDPQGWETTVVSFLDAALAPAAGR